MRFHLDIREASFGFARTCGRARRTVGLGEAFGGPTGTTDSFFCNGPELRRISRS